MMDAADAVVTAADWIKGIALSVLASVIGGASKLAIRKSWLMTEGLDETSGPSEPSESPGSQQQQQQQQDKQQERCHDTSASSQDVSIETSSPHLNDNFLDSPSSPSGIELPERQQRADMDGSGNGVANGMICSVPTMGSSFMDEVTPTTSPAQAKRIRRRSFFLRLSGMIGMTVLNPLCCVLSMNYASPSILAPFSGLTLVWIVLFSETLIHEKPTYIQVAAAALIIVGETIVAVFGDHTNDTGKSIEDVRQSYLQRGILLYFVFMVLWMVMLGYFMTKGKSRLMKRFAWGVSGGSVTGLQNFLKDSLTIIKAVGSGGPSQGEPYPWFFFLLAFLAAMTAFAGLIFLVYCMKRYDGTFSSALFVGSFVLSATVMSAIKYSTFDHLVGLASYILYPFGIITLMAGVGVLVRNASGDLDNNVCRSAHSTDEYEGTNTEERNTNITGTDMLQEPLVTSENRIQDAIFT